MVDLQGRDFLKLLDFSREEIEYLLELSAKLKGLKKAGTLHNVLLGKNVALIFEKTSTRTRCAFEVAAHDLGMGTTYLGPGTSQIGSKESIEDTARVLAGMYDGIEYRGFDQEIVDTLAEYSKVPVWNGLTTEFHPTQMLADMLTAQEVLGTLEGLTLCFMGDAKNNVANSLMVICAKLGVNYVACAPKSCWPTEDLVATCQAVASEQGSTVSVTDDPQTGPAGADIIYTDVWVSMGEPYEVWEERISELSPYQVNADVMARANERAIFLHCLPAFHDINTTTAQDIYERFGLPELEVTDEVFESDRSYVFQEAENRMHTIKAIMAATLGADKLL